MSEASTDIQTGQILELRTEHLAYGGATIARHEGRAVFVLFAAPNEKVRAEITAVEKTFLRARVVEVLEAGPDRIEPRCQHFGDCGGCNYQHINYAAQVAAKAEFVRDAIVRIGRFEDWQTPIKVHQAEPWGYRSRTQLKLKATSGMRKDGRMGRLPKKERKQERIAEDAAASGAPRRPVLGFHRAMSHSVLDLKQCPVLAPELEQGLEGVRDAVQTLPRKEWPYQIEGACGRDGAIWAPDLPGMRKDLVEHEVLGFRYLIEPESFFQGNRLLVDKLVEGGIGDERGGPAFDLYAGVGLFTLPLSKRFERVVSVEDERRAATLGRVNVKINGCNNVHYMRKTTEQFLAANKERPDLVIMDPPRLGAKPALPMLLELGADRIVYVSCDPQTMARDLRTLYDGTDEHIGYEIESIEAFDMFPQTYHVECVARLRRKEATGRKEPTKK
ncbi:MAG: class I SAM-dependent RNA methyltransferase [Planctomycetota bacterium]